MQPRIFIGSSTKALPMAEYAQAELSHISQPEVWENGKFYPHMTPIESLFKALDEFDFALFVAIPEDVTTKRGKSLATMRDNVLFEAGLFMGRLGRSRVFLISPENTADTALELPSDLTGIDPTHYNPSAANVRASVASALVYLRDAIRAFADTAAPIFDSRKNLQTYQLAFKKGKRWNSSGTAPISAAAEGNAKLTNEAIELQRDNDEGTFEIEIRPKGAGEPSISRVPNSDRLFEIRFEARIEETPHTLRVVLMHDKAYEWLSSESFEIVGKEWTTYTTCLGAAPGVDILVRIDDEISGLPSKRVFIRNIVVTQIKFGS
jgi:hypothetical protein